MITISLIVTGLIVMGLSFLLLIRAGVLAAENTARGASGLIMLLTCILLMDLQAGIWVTLGLKLGGVI